MAKNNNVTIDVKQEGENPRRINVIETFYHVILASSSTARLSLSLLQPMSSVGSPGYFRFDDLTASAVGPRLASQRGSWLIIQRKWTKERGMAGSYSVAIRREA